MSEPVTWIGLALAVVVAIERIMTRVKKSTCQCCGAGVGMDFGSNLPSPKVKKDAELQKIDQV